MQEAQNTGASFNTLKQTIKESLPDQKTSRGNCLKRAQAKQAVEWITFAIVVIHMEEKPNPKKDLHKLAILQKIFFVQYTGKFLSQHHPLALELNNDFWDKLKQFYPQLQKNQAPVDLVPISINPKLSTNRYSKVFIPKLFIPKEEQALPVSADIDINRAVGIFKEIVMAQYEVLNDLCRSNIDANGIRREPSLLGTRTPRALEIKTTSYEEVIEIFSSHIDLQNRELANSSNPIQLSLADFGLDILQPKPIEESYKTHCFNCSLQ